MTADIEAGVVRARVCLESGRKLSLRDAAGVTLTPLTGRAWLTMEGDLRDIDLTPGVAYRIERDGLTLVNALEPSLVELKVAQARLAAPWRRWLERAWNYLVRVAEAKARARMMRHSRWL
jgi:hypothetical protein